MMVPLALAGIGIGAKLVGSLFGGKSQEQLKAEAEKKAWDSNEVQRVQRCHNAHNWFVRKAAEGGKPLSTEQAGTDSCPPPQPWSGTTNVGGDSAYKLGSLFGQVGNAAGSMAMNQYGQQKKDK